MRKLTALIFLLVPLPLCLSNSRAQVVQSQSSAQPANVQMTGGVGHGYAPSKGAGLTLNISKGTTQCVDQLVEYGGGTLTMTDNTVNYIYLDPAQTCAHGQNTTGFFQGTVWHYKVTTSGGAITAIDDVRSADTVSKVAITGGGGAGGGTNNQGTVALTGCGVAWTGLLNFTVAPCSYLIAGTQYSSAQTNLTLTTADATFGRIDVIAVDSTGTAIKIDGTPSGSPAEPSVDPATQLRLIAVSVPALATTPSGVTETDLYLENTEWTCAVSSNLACASTSNPFAGSDDIEATAAVAGNNVTLTKPSGTVDLSTYSNLILYIRSKAAWPTAKSLSIFWLNGSTVVGASVSIKTGNFGFNSSTTGTYQQVVVPLGSFATGTNPVNKLKISVAGIGGSIGFYADNVSIQTGVTNGGSGPQTFTITPTSPITGGGTAPFGGTLTVACPTCGTGSGNVTGSSLTSGQLIVGNTGAAITTGNLSGDVTTSGGTAATVVKVNGIAYSATAAAHSVEVVTTANTTATAKAIPDCTDSTGNHLNYTQSTDAFSCGTSSSVSGTVTTSGSPSSGNLTKFSGASAVTNGDLSGDASTSGTLAVTVSKINGTSFSGTNGHVVSFGASNTPADSGIVASAVTQTIASGTSALGTSAISSGACATVVSTTATGTATTDDIMADFNADPTSTTGYQASSSGMLTIIKYPTADHVNFKICNNTGSSVTPGAVTLNWRVVR